MLIRSVQRGFTLIEVLMVSAVFGVISVGVATLVGTSLNSYQYLQLQGDASVVLTNVISRTSKVVRGTTDVVDAQPNTLTVYAYFSPSDAVVKKVRYFVSGNTLNVGVTPPSGSAPTYTYDPANETVRALAQNLSMGSNPIFQYYDAAGSVLSGSFSIAQIRQVGVTVTMNPNPKRLKVPLSDQTIVTLRNKKTNL